MGKLLDEAGVTTLWNKIKSNFVKKTDYATASTHGIVKIGSGISVNDGVISATGYNLPIASSSVLGGVKVGSGLNITAAGVLSADGYTLPTASSSVLGGVKVGSRLSINSGVLSANLQTDNNFTNAYKNKIDGIADYVVDEGTSTTTMSGQTFTWYYKKWNNGTMELWGVCGQMVLGASWQPWGDGGWYYYDYPSFYFPTYFLSGTVPNVQVTPNGAVVLPTTTSVTRDHVDIRIVRVNAPSTTQINMSIYAFGKWQ